MKNRVLPIVAILVLALAGCKENGAEKPQKFDAKAIALEADRGNLEPLAELNRACSAEVEKQRARAENCRTQDEVRALRKPLDLRF